MTDDQASGVATRIAHFGYDGEEAWGSGESEDEGRDGGDGLGERGRRGDLVVGGPGAGLRG